MIEKTIKYKGLFVDNLSAIKYLLKDIVAEDVQRDKANAKKCHGLGTTDNDELVFLSRLL